MEADLTLSLFYLSLGLSAATVVLFLWLLREPPRDTGPRAEGTPQEANREPGGESPPPPTGS